MRILDLFCGIGGVAEAARRLEVCERETGRPVSAPEADAHVAAAIDIDRRLGPIYEANHRVTPICATLESTRSFPAADLWWLSPPCQPYTRRGSQRAEHDPRSAALDHLITRIDAHRPSKLVLENVPQFVGSVHHRRLVAMLERADYQVRTDVHCPTELGLPMRRRRVYVRARRDGRPLADAINACSTPTWSPAIRLVEFLEETPWGEPQWQVECSLLERYRSAIDLVDITNPRSVAACFTSAYGTSPVRAGSYLWHPGIEKIRRFTPLEMARLLGFRDDFWWPDSLDTKARYRLLGNGLAVQVVTEVLGTMR
jgi:site-specific DNA-cytosine methylase